MPRHQPPSWFRLDSKTLLDDRIRGLPDRLFRAWILCLSLARSHPIPGILPPLDQLSSQFRSTKSKILRLLGELVKHGLLHANGDSFTVVNWEDFAPPKTLGSARQKRYRERIQLAQDDARYVTRSEALRNVSAIRYVTRVFPLHDKESLGTTNAETVTFDRCVPEIATESVDANHEVGNGCVNGNGLPSRAHAGPRTCPPAPARARARVNLINPESKDLSHPSQTTTTAGVRTRARVPVQAPAPACPPPPPPTHACEGSGGPPQNGCMILDDSVVVVVNDRTIESRDGGMQAREQTGADSSDQPRGPSGIEEDNFRGVHPNNQTIIDWARGILGDRYDLENLGPNLATWITAYPIAWIRLALESAIARSRPGSLVAYSHKLLAVSRKAGRCVVADALVTIKPQATNGALPTGNTPVSRSQAAVDAMRAWALARQEGANSHE